MFRKTIKGLQQNLSIILQALHVIVISKNTSEYDISDSKEHTNGFFGDFFGEFFQN